MIPTLTLPGFVIPSQLSLMSACACKPVPSPTQITRQCRAILRGFSARLSALISISRNQISELSSINLTLQRCRIDCVTSDCKTEQAAIPQGNSSITVRLRSEGGDPADGQVQN